MEHTIEMDVRNRVAVIRYNGKVRLQHAIDLLDQLLADPRWTPEYDRVVVYDNALMGDVDATEMESGLHDLKQRVSDAYGTRRSYAVQVCSDPLKRPILEYLLGLASQGYPAGLVIVDSVDEAIRFIHSQRAAA